MVEKGSPFVRKAYSERLEGYITEEKIILQGSPKVFQRDDVIRGNTITLRRNNESIEVDDANTKFNLRSK